MNICQHRLRVILKSSLNLSNISSVASEPLKRHYENYVDRINSLENNVVAKQFFEKAYDLHTKYTDTAQRAYDLQVEEAFLSRAPLKDILRIYIELKTTRNLNQFLIANTVYNVGRVFASRQDRSATYWDLDEERLFLHPGFDILVKDISRVMQETPIMDLDALTKITQGLLLLKIKDGTIVNQILDKYDIIVSMDDSNEIKLQNNQKLMKIISYFLKDDEGFQTISISEENNVEEVEISKLFHQLKQTLLKEKSKFLKLVDALSQISKTYNQLLEIQNNNYVTENVNLNFELLDLEEQFVELGLLTVQDVSELNHSRDPNRRLDQLMTRAVDFISSGDQATVQMLKALFSDQDNSLKQDFMMDLSPQLNFKELSKSLNELAKLLNRSGTQDEMINEEWSQSYQTQNCDYDRGLSSLYMKGLQKFKIYFEQIKIFIESKQLKPEYGEGVLFALTFAKIGLFKQANYFMDTLTIDSFKDCTSIDVAHLAEYSLISNTKLEQPLVDLIKDKYMNENNSYDDQELSSMCLALLYQHKVNHQHLDETTKIVQIIIDRFYSIDSLAELDQDTIENLQDIQTYSKIVLTDSKDQQNSLYQILIGSKGSQSQSQSSSNLNPYIMHLQKLFKETSTLHQQFAQFPFTFQPQIFHFNQGSSSTLGVIVVPTRYLSDDGQVNGRVHLRKNIVQQYADNHKLNMRIKVLPLTDLFKFDDTNNTWNLAEKDRFRQVINEVLETSNQDHDLLSFVSKLRNVQDYVELQMQENRNETLKDLIYHKLSLDFKQINQLAIQVSRSVTQNDKAVLLEELKIKSLSFLSTITKSGDNELQTLGEGAKAVVTDIYQLINKLQGTLINTDNTNTSHPQSWIGSLQSENCGKSNESIEGFCVSILDCDFYVDTTYCIYQDLKRQLEISGLLNRSMSQSLELHTSTASLILYPNLKATGKNQSPMADLYPLHHKQRVQIQPQFRADWRDLFKNQPIEKQQDFKDINEFLQQDQENKITATQQDWFVLNLQNLKAEMKINFQPHEVVTNILSLDFWNDLIKEKLQANQSSEQGLFLTRDPRELLNYNLKKAQQQQNVKSPSLSYLETVRSQKKFLRELMKHKKSILRKVQLEAAESRLSQLGAQAVTLKMNKLVEDALKHHKLRNSPFHSSLTFKKQWSFVDINVEENKFDKLNLKTNKKVDDQDLILSQGNLETYLKFKRSRAQDKLILYKILLQMQSNQELSQQDKAYLEHISQHIQLFDYQSSITSLKIKDLSLNDQKFFESFSQSRITDFGEYSLNEVILELSQFFDNQTYQEISNRIAFDSKELKEFGIKGNLLKKRIKNGSHLLVKHKEQEAWAKQSQLNKEELFRMQEILEVPLKLQSLQPVVQQKEKEHSLNSLLLLNKLGFPQSIITKWIESRQDEISNDQYVENLNDEQDNMKLWQTMFGVPYQETSSLEIGKMVESLCQRMFLIKTYQPFFIRRLFTILIQHPNFSLADRNLLASYVEIFKFDLQFTSKDVLNIAQSAIQRQDQVVTQTLVDSNYPYLDKLWHKIQNQQKSKV